MPKAYPAHIVFNIIAQSDEEAEWKLMDIEVEVNLTPGVDEVSGEFYGND